MRAPIALLSLSLVIAATAPAQEDWHALLPSGRGGHAITYDADNRRLVTFGGYTVTELGDTLEWDGARWRERLVQGPSPRFGYSLSYDAARRRVVLYGGATARGRRFAETWEYDGVTWTRQGVLGSWPGALSGHATAYDPTRQVVVLFGGYTGSQLSPNTWEWNGSRWISHGPPTSPEGRQGHAMVWDPSRGRIVMFGGTAGATYFQDTWEWDGAQWSRRQPATRPPGLSGHAMAYDPRVGRVLLFGGFSATGQRTETWEWDGNNWTQRAPAVSPPFGGAMAYDAERQAMVLYGDDTWVWDPTVPTWTRVREAGPRGGAAAFDLARRKMVLFASDGFGVPETWELDTAAIAWQRATVTGPPPRTEYAMAHDAVFANTLLYGGWSRGTVSVLNDTWSWDGVRWSQRMPTAAPPGRRGHAMANDFTGRTLLFGGQSSGEPAAGSGTFLDDTWEWNGQSWTRLPARSSPTPRYQHAMAFDPGNGRVVLFGGVDAGGVRGDTWEWDGATWSQLLPASAPPPQRGHVMVTDLASARVLLCGGAGDVWEWRGATRTWTELSGKARPPTSAISAAYDPVHAQLIALGGGPGAAPFSVTWSFGLSRAFATPFGAGCPGTLGRPTLTANSEPRLGNAAFTLRLGGLPPAAPGFVALSQRVTVAELPASCRYYLPSTLAALPISPLGGGVPLPVPRVSALIGVELFAQGVAVDPNGALFGVLSLSDAMHLGFGL